MRIAIAFLLLPFFADAQIVRAWPFYTAPEEAVAAADSFLNTYGPARAAWSLRILDKNYAGNCIRIRRHSDNAEQNIGFVNGYLDTAAIISFAQGDTAFVTTLYDQSGQANNATQSTAINQARIYIDSVFERINGKIAIFYDGVSDMHSFSNPSLYADSNHTIISVYTHYSGTNNRRIVHITNGNTNRIALSGAGNYTLITSTTSAKSVSAISGAQHLLFSENSPQELYVDNNPSTGTASGATVSSASFQINSSGVNNALAMHLQELILFNENKSSDRTGIQNNINAFYSIY